jgi:glycosyltransferase involved in cell wall biosynthesis
MLELAEELIDRGHTVTVITTWPSYNLDKSLNSRDIREIELENGITVIRVKTLPHHNVNYVLRGISQIFMPLQFLYYLKKHQIRPKIVIIYSPPLPLGLVGVWLSIRNTQFILNIQDIFPQNAIDLGILKNGKIIFMFRKLEKFIYSRAQIITTHSEGNSCVIRKNYPQVTNKLRVLNNWVDIKHHELRKSFEVTNFRTKWGIKNKYIAVFAGVMGPSQYLGLILDIASRFRNESELLFLLVGDGIERAKLEMKMLEMNLTNVRFENFISRENYPALLKECDVGLVCLSPQNKTPVVPGKILGYMAAGLPVAAFLHLASDGWDVIRNSKCGVVADSGNIDSCIDAMRSMLTNFAEFNSMGISGKKYCSDHFSKDVCVTRLEEMFVDR